MMFDLVIWSFVIALAPVVMGFGWKMFVSAGVRPQGDTWA